MDSAEQRILRAQARAYRQIAYELEEKADQGPKAKPILGKLSDYPNASN